MFPHLLRRMGWMSRLYTVKLLRTPVEENTYFGLIARSNMRTNCFIDRIHETGALQLPVVVFIDSSNRFFVTEEALYMIL
jgi:hypothetical protein